MGSFKRPILPKFIPTLGTFQNVLFFVTHPCTVLVCRMSHRKWRETKQEPSRARLGHQISSCLVSLHFLCDILATGTVQSCVKTFWLSSNKHPQNVPLLTPKLHHGTIFQAAILKTWQECFYTTMYFLIYPPIA